MQNLDGLIVASFSIKLERNDGGEPAQQYCCASRVTDMQKMEDLMAVLRMMIDDVWNAEMN
jgi:hypothetical protein